MKKPLILLTLMPLAFTACTSSGPSKKDPEYEINFRGSFSDYEISYKFQYNFKMFDESGENFNKTLSLMSFAEIIKASDKTSINTVLSKFGFVNIVNSSDYDEVETKDSLKYTIALKELEEYNIINVVTNGINYTKPWENNFSLGKTGDAQGFVTPALRVIDSIKSYKEEHNDKPIKLWMTGYSRSAAVTDIVAYRLLEENFVSEENCYVYTFEAPKAVDVNNVKEHKSIHNIYSRADFVTYMAPGQYDLSRVGEDIDIYSSKIDKYVRNLNKQIPLDPFVPASSYYSNEKELIELVINNVLATGVGSEDIPDMSTRDNFVDNYQDDFTYLISFAFGLKSSTISSIVTALGEKSYIDYLGFLAQDELYNFLEPILDAASETYDKDKLKTTINKMVNFVSQIKDIFTLAIQSGFIGNMKRVVESHMPEVVLALLINFEYQN